MYKQMIPADVVAREAQSRGPANKANGPGFEMKEVLGQPFDPTYHDAVSTRAEAHLSRFVQRQKPKP